MAEHVTLRDIARRTGLSVSAVSMALRNHVETSLATRQRVQSVACEMGYRRDPMLSALSAYRHGDRRALAALAFLTTGATPDGWRTQYGELLLEGARREARRLGYDLACYWLDPNVSGARHGQILEARGTVGLLVAPVDPHAAGIDFEWERFAVVALGHTLHAPRLSRARTDLFGGLLMVCRELRQMGYRRIGLAMFAASDEYVEGLWSAAVLKDQASVPAASRVEPLWHDTDVDAVFRRWLDRENPDVVIAYGDCYPRLLAAGRRVPDDVGFVLLSDYPRVAGEPPFAALNHNFEAVGAAGTALLHTLCVTNSRGVPAVRVSVTVDAAWVPGGTVRRMGGSADHRPPNTGNRRS